MFYTRLIWLGTSQRHLLIGNQSLYNPPPAVKLDKISPFLNWFFGDLRNMYFHHSYSYFTIQDNYFLLIINTLHFENYLFNSIWKMINFEKILTCSSFIFGKGFKVIILNILDVYIDTMLCQTFFKHYVL